MMVITIKGFIIHCGRRQRGHLLSLCPSFHQAAPVAARAMIAIRVRRMGSLGQISCW